MLPIDPSYRLQPGLDPRRAAVVYARSGRVHLTSALAADGARRAHASLESGIPWQLHFNDRERTHDLDLAGLEALPPSSKEALVMAIHNNAARGFQFLFDNFPVSDAYQQGRLMELEVMRLHEFVNSEEFLQFARQLTGVQAISLADSQATRYRPGHFLTCHDDREAGKHRVAAYVLNLTPEWRSDWGGLLNFIDEDGHVAEAYTPRFNALNVFRVPQKHAVSCVAPFAPAARYSISGWLRTA